MSKSAGPRVAMRNITAADLPGLAALLRSGFPRRTLSYWVEGLRHLGALTPPDGMPQFGHLLAAAGQPVGVLLMISSTPADAPPGAVRCNVSSWYVRPEFRAYAPLLSLRAIENKAATYINVWPAAHTLPAITAQGFVQGAAGLFACLPALGRWHRGVRILSRAEDWARSRFISPAQLRLLAEHQDFGCLCLWCETADGGCPFIFRWRLARKLRVPCAMLIYAESLDHLEDFAGPLGRFLLARGMPVMLAGAHRPLRGVPGRYFPEKLHIYYKGTLPPRGSDLSYTEAAVFGI